MDDYVHARTTALIAEARQHIDSLAQGVPGFMAERIRAGKNDDPRVSLIVRMADRLELILAKDPPDGWFPFGSHVGFDGPMEFSDETDEAGDPKWERHAVTA